MAGGGGGTTPGGRRRLGAARCPGVPLGCCAPGWAVWGGRDGGNPPRGAGTSPGVREAPPGDEGPHSGMRDPPRDAGSPAGDAGPPPSRDAGPLPGRTGPLPDRGTPPLGMRDTPWRCGIPPRFGAPGRSGATRDASAPRPRGCPRGSRSRCRPRSRSRGAVLDRPLLGVGGGALHRVLAPSQLQRVPSRGCSSLRASPAPPFTGGVQRCRGAAAPGYPNAAFAPASCPRCPPAAYFQRAGRDPKRALPIAQGKGSFAR